jgi:hypothetical protein
MARSVVPLLWEMSIYAVRLKAHLRNPKSAAADVILTSPPASDYSCVDFPKRPKDLIAHLRAKSSVPWNCIETVNTGPGVAA